MKCVILAAGEGMRMRPLTLTTPKPLLAIAGKPILEHIGNALPPEITKLIIVTGYLGGQIQTFCGNRFFGRPVTYIEQAQKLGTAHALKLCRSELDGERFLLLYADDLHNYGGLAAMLAHPRSLLVAEHPEPQRFGVVSLHPDGTVAGIVEKPERPLSNLVSTGAMVLDRHIFDYEPDLHSNGEYYLTSMFDKMIRDVPVVAVQATGWFPVAAPGDLTAGEAFLRPKALR